MVISVIPAKAQCAACAAQVETNTSNGGKAARGLNAGILFLMFAPYAIVGVGGYIWYKSYRRKNDNIKADSKKLHLN